ncbi:BlaI/MecI/CopY family transcriptional regulator [Symmachiella dynata]|nr:BlaI/MecI/CopY family transcriptional regulator [Symmachiella dynata]
MPRPPQAQLSRRERQIMDIVYRRGSATAAEIRAELADPPSYSTVRTLLRVLLEKGHLKHKQDGPRYVYSPTLSAEKARRSALKQVLTTFFDGSAEKAMATLIDMSSAKLSQQDLNQLAQLIEHAKQGEKK